MLTEKTPLGVEGLVKVLGPADSSQAAADQMESNLEARLDRLTQRVLDGLCVPFLGAGISRSCPAKTENPPKTDAGAIAEKLAKSLFAHLPPSSAGEIWLQKLRSLGLDSARMQGNGDFIPDENNGGKTFVPALGEVAELCWSVLRPSGTCKVLEMERWDELLPTAAHHYLAILVREGLITEVLETNYDELVEQAVRETFGESSKGHEHCAPVISDLESYRKHIAGSRNTRRHRALVKVVKLNGCAAAYRRVVLSEQSKAHERESAARSIVLTEEQLQGWGNKHWARELLNDRVRSRSLLFIGFGNADPIVRHHSMQVIREFQAYAEGASHPPDASSVEGSVKWYEHNNAPFIAIYGSNLSFYQYQLLRAFRDAHSVGLAAPTHEGTESERRRVGHEQLLHVASVYENTFLGDDGRLLAGLTGGLSAANLPADVFLLALAVKSLCRLAPEKWFDPESPLHSYLQGALRHPKTLLSGICHELFGGGVEKPARFAEWIRLKSSSQKNQESSPWGTVCFAIRGQRPGRAGYRPFLESPIKQPMLVVLMALAALRDGAARIVFPTGDELLNRVRVGSSPAATEAIKHEIPAYRLIEAEPAKGGRAVFATADVDGFLYGESGAPLRAGNDEIPPDHSVVVALGRGNIHAFRSQIWFEVKESDGKDKNDESRVRVIREIYVVGDLAAIRGGGWPPCGPGSGLRQFLWTCPSP